MEQVGRLFLWQEDPGVLYEYLPENTRQPGHLLFPSHVESSHVDRARGRVEDERQKMIRS